MLGRRRGKSSARLVRLEEVACDMRAVARKELLGDYSRIDDDKLSARWLACLPRRTRRAARIAPTIDTVARDLEELKKQYHEELGHRTGLPLAATCTEQPACSSSSAAGGQEETETCVTTGIGNVLVERVDDVKRIIDIINSEVEERKRAYSSNAVILPIFGLPCVGKTTLVKSVLHDQHAFEECYYKVGVHMRKGWGIKEIHESIIDQLGRHHFNGYEYELNDGRRCCIRKVESEADYGRYISEMLWLYGKRLFLILDNLQVEEQDLSMLDKLLGYLQNDFAHVIIAIMTTRSEDLARYIARCSKIAEYRLHPCSDDMCWKIIKQTSGLDLEATAAGTAVTVSDEVGREIASKCSGRPLAAKALGRFLRSVDPKEWPGLIRDVWNIGGGFSCDSLPTHSATVFTYLKRSIGVDLGAESWFFLAYCAFVFPKDKGHSVATGDLLNQWCFSRYHYT